MLGSGCAGVGAAVGGYMIADEMRVDRQQRYIQQPQNNHTPAPTKKYIRPNLFSIPVSTEDQEEIKLAYGCQLIGKRGNNLSFLFINERTEKIIDENKQIIDKDEGTWVFYPKSPTESGSYKIVAEIKDNLGRVLESETKTIEIFIK